MSSWPEVERAIIKSTCTSISYVLSCFTGRPGWQVEEQTDRFLDRVVARARRTGPTCPGTGIELLYLSWLWIKGLNVSPQVNTAAPGLISHLQWFSWGRGRCNNNTFHSVSSPGWEATVKAVVRRRGICCAGSCTPASLGLVGLLHVDLPCLHM